MQTISSLWIGPEPTFLEHLVVQSYLDAGHDFVVYSDHPAENFPAGAKVIHPQNVVPELTLPKAVDDRHSAAVYSDLFRLHLLQRTETIWVDMDAYCVRRFDFESSYVFGHDGTGHILNGVLGAPQDSKAIDYLCRMMTMKNPAPIWLNKKLRSWVEKQRRKGRDWTIYDFPWGISGPRALSLAMKEFDLLDHMQPKNVFYSSIGDNWRHLMARDGDVSALETPETVSVHFFGKTKEVLAKFANGLPMQGSYIEMICKRHNIDPTHAPVRSQTAEH